MEPANALDANISWHAETRTVDPRSLRHPAVHFAISEYCLRDVIRVCKEIQAHDFSKDIYAAITRHANLGTGIVASFSRFKESAEIEGVAPYVPEFFVISLAGVRLHYTLEEFQNALEELKQANTEMIRARMKGPLVASGFGPSVMAEAEQD